MLNKFEIAEAHAAQRVYSQANYQARQYASDVDLQAATVALLAEALILAGGGNLLKNGKNEPAT